MSNNGGSPLVGQSQGILELGVRIGTGLQDNTLVVDIRHQTSKLVFVNFLDMTTGLLRQLNDVRNQARLFDTGNQAQRIKTSPPRFERFLHRVATVEYLE